MFTVAVSLLAEPLECEQSVESELCFMTQMYLKSVTKLLRPLTKVFVYP